jgi:hypothetical protein
MSIAVKVNVRLRKCPFCGGMTSEQTRTFKRMGDLPGKNERRRGRMYWVGCFNDTCWQPRTYGTTEKLATGNWNRRSGR